MNLAIGDKVRLKEWITLLFFGSGMRVTTRRHVEEAFVLEVNEVSARLSPDKNRTCFWVTRDSVEKVEDKPVDERVLRTMRAYLMSLDNGRVNVKFEGGDSIEEFSVDSETAKTIRLGDEYEVIIRRK